MGLRLAQRPTPLPSVGTATAVVARGGVITPYSGVTYLSYGAENTITVMGKYVISGAPGAGNWTISVPELAGHGRQVIGQMGMAGLSTSGGAPALLDNAGVITSAGTLPEPGATCTLTFQGMVA
jgi:hypothetical protein